MGVGDGDEASGTCRVAIIGAGSMAREHVRALQDISEAEVVAIHSRTPERAEALAREFGIGLVTRSIEELYERSRAQLAVIAVPELATQPVTSEAMRYPWTQLIEKPAGYNPEQAGGIADAARGHRRQAFVALNRRCYSSTRAALAGVVSDGGLRFIRVLDQQDQVAAAANGQPVQVVSNWMYANSIHVIDLMRVFGRGTVTSVDRVIAWDPKSPGQVVAKVAFSSGDVGLYEGVWNGPGPWAVQIMTPDQMWDLRPLERAAVQRRGERTWTPVPPDAIDETFKPGFRRQAHEAVRAALGHPAELPTLEEGLDTMRLIQRIFEPA